MTESGSMKKLNFKKIFLIAALFFAASGLSAASVYAAPGCPAGCDCPRDPEGNFSTQGIMGQMEAFGEAERVKDKAQAQQIIKQPDNSPGLTCFDRQLALTAKLGNIFSDNFPANMPPFSNIFRRPAATEIPWNYEKAGMDQMLAKGLKNVLTGTDQNPGLLQRHAQNFTSSLSFDLGATNQLNFMNTLAASLFDPATGALDSIFANTNSYFDQIFGTPNGAFAQLNTLISGVSQGQLATTVTSIAGAVGLAGVVSAINSVNQVLNQIETYRTQFNQAYYNAQNTAYGYVNGIAASANSLLGNYAGRVLGGLFGALGLNSDSMLGHDGAEACDRMAKLWGDKPANWPGGISKAITGIGGDKGVPYFRLQDMLGGLQPDGTLGQLANNVNVVQALCPAGNDGCDDLITVIGLTPDSEAGGVLDTLRGLLAENGPLAGPQSENPNATWIKAETVLSRKNVTLQQIVTAIQNGP